MVLHLKSHNKWILRVAAHMATFVEIHIGALSNCLFPAGYHMLYEIARNARQGYWAICHQWSPQTNLDIQQGLWQS